MPEDKLRTDIEQRLFAVYDLFNRREMEAVLALMHPNVDWPNGMEGGRVHGRDGVRDYWTRQWSLIDPHVEPVDSSIDEAGRIVLRVHQTVRDLAGKLILDQYVEHVYTMMNDLIARMDIREPRP